MVAEIAKQETDTESPQVGGKRRKKKKGRRSCVLRIERQSLTEIKSEREGGE